MEENKENNGAEVPPKRKRGRPKQPLMAKVKPAEKKGLNRKNWIPDFLTGLADQGNVSWASRKAGVSPSTAWKRRYRDPVFAEAWDEALDIATDELELQARKRAKGMEEPVLDPHTGEPILDSRGDPVTLAYKPDTTLLIFLLKAYRPSKFRDNFSLTALVESIASAKSRLALPVANGSIEGIEGTGIPD